MPRDYTNLATLTALSAGIDNSVATIPLVSAVGWLDPGGADVAVAAIGYGTATLEVITYTGISGNSLTGVTRGLDGTSAQSHLSGVVVAHAVSAEDINAFTDHLGNTYNPHSVTKSQVGLGSADDTSDANKPVSTATQTALDFKAPLANPTFTGTVAGPTAAPGTNTTQFASTAYVIAEILARLAVGDFQSYKGAIDASGNPNYPAGNAGDVYRISVAGKIGGASGPDVLPGDILMLHVDASAGGNHATVGADWDVIPSSLDTSISAFIRTLLDDANAAAALTTLGAEVAGTSATHTALTAAHGATGAVVGTTNTQTLTGKTATDIILNGEITGTAGIRAIRETGGPTVLTLGAGVDGQWWKRVGTTFVTAKLPFRELIALSNETTALTTGQVLSFPVRVPFTLTEAPISVVTAPTGAALIVNCKKNGTTIWSTKPQIDATETDSDTGVAGTLSGATSFVRGDVISFHVDQIGSTIAGAGLKTTLIGLQD